MKPAFSKLTAAKAPCTKMAMPTQKNPGPLPTVSSSSRFMNSFTSQKFWLTIGRSDVNVKISMVHCQGLHLKFSAWLTSTLFIWLMLTLNCDSIQNWMMLMMLWIWITALLLTDACFDAGQKTFHWRDSTSHYVWPTQTNHRKKSRVHKTLIEKSLGCQQFSS